MLKDRIGDAIARIKSIDLSRVSYESETKDSTAQPQTKTQTEAQLRAQAQDEAEDLRTWLLFQLQMRQFLELALSL